MKYYHCADRDCEATFQAERAKFCPCCGGRELRHALGREIDEMQQQDRQETIRLIPIYAMGA